MKALVLCAGFGTRLGDLTRETPKALLPVGGEPLLAHTLRTLAGHGFDDVAINLHFRADAIVAFIGDGSRFGVRVTWSPEEALLGTAGAVKRLAPFFSGADDFLVLYGDLLLDQDLGALAAYHRGAGATATLLLHQRPGSNSLVACTPPGRITGFVERPTPEERARHPYPWVNSGVQMLSQRVLSLIPGDRPCDLPRDVYVPHVGDESLHGFPLSGYRCAIDSPERLREADAALRDGRCRSPRRRADQQASRR